MPAAKIAPRICMVSLLYEYAYVLSFHCFVNIWLHTSRKCTVFFQHVLAIGIQHYCSVKILLHIHDICTAYPKYENECVLLGFRSVKTPISYDFFQV